MALNKNKRIVIIGNGISGVTCARYIRKLSDHQITIISDESDEFFSRTALMYIFMGHMKYEHTKPYEPNFWKKNKIQLVRGFVQKVKPNTNELNLEDGTIIKYDELVIATGSKYNTTNWSGKNLKGVTGLYHLQDLEKLEEAIKWGNTTVIVGGGLIGIELAEMLVSRKLNVIFLVREPSYWSSILPMEESRMISNHILEHKIDLRLQTEISEIISDDIGRVKAVITKDGNEISCQIVCLSIGVSPNVDFLKDSGLEIKKGLLINKYFETNVPNIYAIGDCAEHREQIEKRPNIESVWYTGRIMGETLAQNLCGSKMDYNPGPWFNSAKFFDIEYQTYGWVSTVPTESESQFYWEDSKSRMSIRIAFDSKSRILLGVNALGIRLEHRFFDYVLRQKMSVDEVLRKL